MNVRAWNILRFCLRKYDVVLCVNKNHTRRLDGGGSSQIIAAGCHFSI